MRVLILGTFDILHEGHTAFLHWGRRLAGPYEPWRNELVVGLNTDRFAASYKRPPVMSYQERKRVLGALRDVDRVEPNDQEDGTIDYLLKLVRPGVVVAPGDWHGRDWHGQVGVPVEEFWRRGIAVAWVPGTPGVSTTDIIGRLTA